MALDGAFRVAGLVTWRAAVFFHNVSPRLVNSMRAVSTRSSAAWPLSHWASSTIRLRVPLAAHNRSNCAPVICRQNSGVYHPCDTYL
jgi:hypothetical protein